MVDKRQNVLEKLIIEEAIGEFMDLLTDRQRQVIHQIYFQQRTQREVSRVFWNYRTGSIKMYFTGKAENEKKCRQTDRSASEGRIKDAW